MAAGERKGVDEGVRFLTVSARQARFIHSAGVWVLRRSTDGAVLAAGVGVDLGPEATRSAAWEAAVRAGADEFLFTLGPSTQGDLARFEAQLRAMLPRRDGSACSPASLAA